MAAMTEWVELRAYLKLLWVIIQVRLGRKEENTSLNITPAEADALKQFAAENGYRALLIALQTTGGTDESMQA